LVAPTKLSPLLVEKATCNLRQEALDRIEEFKDLMRLKYGENHSSTKVNKTTARPTLFLIAVDLAVVFVHAILPA